MAIDEPEKTPRVSVVMRCKNADWVVGNALAALYSQDYKDFELIVVDSGSTDRSLDLIRAYPHRLVQIEPSDYYPGRVLNNAIREQARGEIIVFQNSDGVPLSTETLGRLVAPFDDPAVAATLTRQLPRPEADSWVRREYNDSFPDKESTPPWITLSLPMAAMRKSAWEKHPFYSDAWGSEDTEWGNWAKKYGLKIEYVKDALIMHSHNYTLKQLYGRRFIEGEADAFIYKRKEDLVRMTGRVVVQSLRDVKDCIKSGDFSDIPRIPARRAVFHWAYLKGHLHGKKRIEENNTDASVGQKTVLERHESVRDKK